LPLVAVIFKSLGDGVFCVRSDLRRLETQHYIAFGNASFFQSLHNSQIGVIDLQPGFSVDEFKTDDRPMNVPLTRESLYI